MKNNGLVWVFVFGIFISSAGAADYYLDNVKGADANDGSADAPMATFTALESKLKPGDVVYLNPTGVIYRQSFIFTRAGGEPDKPLVLEGNGQTVSGAEIIPADAWKKVADGVFRAAGVPARIALIVAGKMVLEQLNRDSLEPGEWCWCGDEKLLYFMPAKGQNLADHAFEATLVDNTAVTLSPVNFQRSHSKIGALRYRDLKEVKALSVDGKTAALGGAKERLASGAWTRDGDGVRFRPAPGVDPLDATARPIEAIVRENGFGLYGKASYVTIRHVNTQHVSNDAYNIHGRHKGIVIDRANAFQCGDEGISAHGECEVVYSNAAIRECDNGINHIQNSKSVTRNVFIADCRANGLEYQLGKEARHEVENLVLYNNRTQMAWSGEATSPVLIRNALAVSTGGSALMSFTGSDTTMENLTCIAPSLRLMSAGKSPLRLKNAWFATPKMEFDFRVRPLDFLALEAVRAPGSAQLQNAGRGHESFHETGIAGLEPLDPPTPATPEALLAAIAGKPLGAPPELFKLFADNVSAP